MVRVSYNKLRTRLKSLLFKRLSRNVRATKVRWERTLLTIFVIASASVAISSSRLPPLIQRLVTADFGLPPPSALSEGFGDCFFVLRTHRNDTLIMHPSMVSGRVLEEFIQLICETLSKGGISGRGWKGFQSPASPGAPIAKAAPWPGGWKCQPALRHRKIE